MVQADSYLSIVIRLYDKDSVEIVRATVIRDKLIQRNTPASDHLYEVSRGDEVVAVAFPS